jgi:hypothetical protein
MKTLKQAIIIQGTKINLRIDCDFKEIDKKFCDWDKKLLQLISSMEFARAFTPNISIQNS